MLTDFGSTRPRRPPRAMGSDADRAGLRAELLQLCAWPAATVFVLDFSGKKRFGGWLEKVAHSFGRSVLVCIDGDFAN